MSTTAQTMAHNSIGMTFDQIAQALGLTEDQALAYVSKQVEAGVFQPHEIPCAFTRYTLTEGQTK
jgi:predicted transcriptional regulator